jgi:RHS repeat-associated protein
MPEINFFWDPLSDNILQERDETGAVTAEYTAEPGLYGNIISQNRGGVESQFHYDAQGSTLAVTDDNQNVTDTFAYTAFGEVTERTGTSEVPFQYIGQKGYYRDDGSTYVRARRYSTTTIRWLSRDPLGTRRRSANVYSYVLNAPLAAIDPSGLDVWGVTPPPAQPFRAGPCRISLRCQYVHYGLATHCGLDVTVGETTWSIDGTGGDVNRMDWVSPPYGIGETTEAGDFPLSTCECLRTETIRWNALDVAREPFKRNSNWTLHCFASRCNITLAFSGSFGVFRTPPGWDCQECLEFAAGRAAVGSCGAPGGCLRSEPCKCK